MKSLALPSSPGGAFLDATGLLSSKFSCRSDSAHEAPRGVNANVLRSPASTTTSSPRDQRGAGLRERSELAEGGGGSGREASRGGPRPPFPSSCPSAGRRRPRGMKEMRNYASAASPPEAAGGAVATAS